MSKRFHCIPILLLGLISWSCSQDRSASNVGSASPAASVEATKPEHELELRPGLIASLIINPRHRHPQHLTLERKTEYSGTVAINVHYVVSLNDFEVAVVNERYADLERYFYLAELDRYVIVLTTASGGNGCPSRFVLYFIQ